MRLAFVLSPLLLAATAMADEKPLTALPYEPSLDLASMDRTADPCTDFYQYVCGGWQKRNPIPPDEASWSVYGKLEHENEQFLWGVLEQVSKPGGKRTAAEQKIGDYYAACMDTAAIARRGTEPLQAGLKEIAALKSTAELAPLLGRLHRRTGDAGFLFGFGSDQDWADSEKVIAEVSAGGLGLPDRDQYLNTDAKSVETRQRYLAHVARMLELSGEVHDAAARDAAAILALETRLAQASLTRVEKRDPHAIAHHAKLSELQAMTPAFSWAAYLPPAGAGGASFFNVTEPKFLGAVSQALQEVPLDTWKAYLRWHLVHAEASVLPPAFDQENFAFYGHHLRGVEQQPPRWKRCVQWVDRDLGEALGQAFVSRTFGPEVKQRTVQMTHAIEQVMESEIDALDWMSAPTKQAALKKLHSVVNKVGYPEKWRDYGALSIKRGDFAGNVERAATFEWKRQLAKIGKPLDRGEWPMTAPTVDAYFNPQMNDINFPAGVLQPPLFDFKLDDAPNYGNTGSTIGHELTHGFDDEGRQFDEKGNLRDWWTAEDAAAFQKRAQCIVDQYAQYPVVDEVKINSKLTLGEDVADLGGTVLAYLAWKKSTAGQKLEARDGLTPEQRFFVGFGQWACSNERPENLLLHALTNPHSPTRARINGVVVNMPEFAKAFACKPGAPMVSARPCKVW